MESLGKFTAFCILLTVSMLVTGLHTHVILSCSALYELDIITQFSFAQVYCLLMIIGLSKFKRDKDAKDKDFADTIVEGIQGTLYSTVLILFVWGILFLVHPIIT